MKRSPWRAARAAWSRPRPRPQCVVSCTTDRWGFVDGVRSASTSGHGSGIPKGLNTNNPFEIKFHVEDIPDDAAEEIAGIESCFFEDEIEKFHSEMIGVFGSEPEAHDDGGDSHPTTHAPTPPSQYTRATSVPAHTVMASTATPSASPASVRHVEPVHLAPSPRRTRSSPLTTATPFVKLIQGPCTYVHDGWVGSKDRWSAHEVETMVGRLAQTHGLHVEPHHSNHEGQILDWLLATAPGDKIILNWNGRLADSPVVYRALSSIRAFVVVLAPLDVELGPLPPSVKGVISGLGTRSLELAIQACK